MSGLKDGDKFPDGVEFSYIPWTEENDSPTSCGIPTTYKASEQWADKKVVLFAVPGAFTPGCSVSDDPSLQIKLTSQVRHLPGYIENLTQIRGKGVDVIAVIATNDAFVMSAWGKVNGVKDSILMLSDPDAKFSKSIGWDMGVSPNRTARYAMIIDKGVVRYAEKEPGRDVSVSGALAVLAKL